MADSHSTNLTPFTNRETKPMTEKLSTPPAGTTLQDLWLQNEAWHQYASVPDHLLRSFRARFREDRTPQAAERRRLGPIDREHKAGGAYLTLWG